MHRVAEATGTLELVTKVQVPKAARKIQATFCPSDDLTEPEFIAMGGEDTSERLDNDSVVGNVLLGTTIVGCSAGGCIG